MTLPGWTCPSLDRLARLVRRHVPEPDRTAALATIEGVRADHILLRAAATDRDPIGLDAVLTRIGHLLAHHDDLLDDQVISLAARAAHPDGLAPATWPPIDEPTPMAVHLAVVARVLDTIGPCVDEPPGFRAGPPIGDVIE